MPGTVELLHLLQQAVNALQVSAFYALLAVAYVLLHGVSNRFNLAFGAIATWAGYVTIGMALSLFETTFWDTLQVLLAALAAALFVGGSLGYVVGRLVMMPVMRGPGLTALIATLGLAIALEEAMRIATSSEEFWLQPIYDATLLEIARPDYPVRVSVIQVLVLAASALLVLGIALLMHRSRFGRAWRACADDPGMLELLGGDVTRLIVLSSIASCLTSAATGFLLAAHYGNITFTNGFLLAAKALFVAIVGGLRSIQGAFVGGLALGFAETFWSAYFPLDYRDVATFVALTAVVVLREGTRRRIEQIP
jgi:branched-chain amino acid transport system permease protein